MIKKLDELTPAPSAPRSAKLGEELPVFCEKCGYQLHGLTPLRCDHCDILHFNCPECAHHQPINTLRPAFQTFLGRMRGAWLVIVVFVKLNFIFWSLFALGAAGAGLSYGYDEEAMQAQQASYQKQMAVYNAAVATQAQLQAAATTQPALQAQAAAAAPTPPTWSRPPIAPRKLDVGARVALSIMGIVFGMIARMMLLRWRRGAAVGAALAALTATAIVIGIAIYRATEWQTVLPWPWKTIFPGIFIWSCGLVLIGALIVWPIWTVLVKAFLPARTAEALLAWQRSLSNRVSTLAREPQIV